MSVRGTVDSPPQTQSAQRQRRESQAFKPLRCLCVLCVCGGELPFTGHAIDNRSHQWPTGIL